MKKRTKNTLKTALHVWGRLIMTGIMCAVTFLSMSVLGNGVLAQDVGYQIVEITQSGDAAESKLIKEHYYTEGETPIKEMDLPENQRFVPISEMSPGVKTMVDIVSLVLMLFLQGVFPYNVLWELGSKDENRVRYRGMTPDPLRGLKVGLLATIPTGLLYVCLLLSKLSMLPGVVLSIYRILNIPYLPFINWILPADVAITSIAFWRVLVVAVTLLFVPIVCWVSYLLGYRQFSLREHMTYKLPKNEKKQDEEI